MPRLALLVALGTAAAFEPRCLAPVQRKNRLIAAAAPLVLAGVLAVGIPDSALAGDKEAGQVIFTGNCRACHARGQNIIMPEKTLQQEDLEQYLSGGATEESVVKQVSNGKNAMPAFGGRLSDEDIANVATYVIATAKAGWD